MSFVVIMREINNAVKECIKIAEKDIKGILLNFCSRTFEVYAVIYNCLKDFFELRALIIL